MRTPEQSNASRLALRAQLLTAELSPAMRTALLAAKPTVDETTWDSVNDYCPGHESLGGGSMMESVYCEPSDYCHQAQCRYEADHEPDPDVLHVPLGDAVKLTTVVALMKRAICLDGRAENGHRLTELGYAVHAHLKAQEGTR